MGVGELSARVQTSAARIPQGRVWLQELPELIGRARERWGLRVGPMYPAGSVSWCAQVTLPGGEPAVLKLSVPHDEARYEAVALRWWDGNGAVRLIDHAPDDWALLLERADPGLAMGSWRGPIADRLIAAGQLLAGLAGGPAQPVDAPTLLPDLAAVAAAWARLLRERFTAAIAAEVRTDPALVRAAVEVLSGVIPGSNTVLHGDANPGNLLRHRGRWVAIDPKPMCGPLAYDLWPVVEQLGAPRGPAATASRVGGRCPVAVSAGQVLRQRTGQPAGVLS